MYKKQKQYRLFGYDYSQNGYYFITIVTKNRVHFFGTIADQKITLSPIGDYLHENIRKFHVDENSPHPWQHHPHYINNSNTIAVITSWAILPNHVHLIVKLINKTPQPCRSVTGLSPLSTGSVSAFINHFKGHIKKWSIQNNYPDFDWQARFHDRVIRNKAEYENIAWYIENNVVNWKEDDL